MIPGQNVILEGLATTRNADGTFNVAPMGPIVDEGMEWLLLRPFQSSTTFGNLVRERCGVFHVVDDVLLLARAAIDRMRAEDVATQPAVFVEGVVLQDACRWYEFEVELIDDSQERAEMSARVVHTGRLRDVFGFNRAKHAVLEAAILATRVGLLPAETVRAEMERLRSPVEKTCGPREREAFEMLVAYVETALSERSAKTEAAP